MLAQATLMERVRASATKIPTPLDFWPQQLRSIRQRLILLIAVCSIPIWAVACGLFYVDYLERRATIDRGLIDTARALSQGIDAEFDKIFDLLAVLSNSQSLAQRDFAVFYAEAKKATDLLPGSDIILADASGQQIVNTFRAFGELLPRRAALDVVARIFSDGQPLVSDLYVGAVTGRPIIGLDIPVRLDGKIVFDLAVTLPADRLSNLLFRQSLPPGWVGFVLDRQGITAGRTRDSAKYVGRSARPEFLEVWRTDNEGALDNENFDGEPQRMAFSRSSKNGWTVGIGVPQALIEQGLIGAFFFAAAGLTFITLVGLMVAWSFARRISTDLRADLNESESEYRLLVESITDVVCLVDAAMVVRYISPADFVMRGFTPSEVVGRSFFDTLTPSSNAMVRIIVRDRLPQDQAAGFVDPTVFEAEQICKNGATIWVEAHSRARLDESGAVIGYTLVLRDVSVRRASAEAQESAHRFVKGVIDGLVERVGVIDAAGTLLLTNAAWSERAAADHALFGLSVGDNYLQACDRLATGGHQQADALAAAIRAVIYGDAEQQTVELSLPSRRDDDPDWYLVHVSALPGEEPRKFNLAHEDITERKSHELDLARAASTDFLTGIANRRQFVKQLDYELARFGRYRHPVSLLMFDLDHFKRINDNFGHAVGDQMLRAVAHTAAGILRTTDLLSRTGGEEFSCILPETKLDDARVFAERLRQRIEQMTVAGPNGPIGITISLGLTTADKALADDTPTIEAMMARADKALYAAKDAGRNCVVSYHDLPANI